MKSYNAIYIFIAFFTTALCHSQTVYAYDDTDAVAPECVPALFAAEDAVPGRVLLSWDAPQNDIAGNQILPENLTYMVYMNVNGDTMQPLFEVPGVGRTLIYEVCKPDEKAIVYFAVLPYHCRIPAMDMTYSEKMAVGRAQDLPYFNGFTPIDQETYPIYWASEKKNECNLQFIEPSHSQLSSGDDDGYYAVASSTEQDTFLEIFSEKINLIGTHHPEMSIRHYRWDASDLNHITIYGMTSDGVRKEIADIDHSQCNTGWNTFVCDLSPLKRLQPQIILHIDFLSPHSLPIDTWAIYQTVDSVEEIGSDAPEDICFELTDSMLVITDKRGNTRYTVNDLSGRIMCSNTGSRQLSLSPGVYFLRTPSHTHRILIP